MKGKSNVKATVKGQLFTGSCCFGLLYSTTAALHGWVANASAYILYVSLACGVFGVTAQWCCSGQHVSCRSLYGKPSVGMHHDMMLLCMQALPSEEGVQWREQEELQDLYSVYVGRDKDAAKQGVIQKLFSLSDQDAKSLQEVVEAGEFKLEAEEDDSSFF